MAKLTAQDLANPPQYLDEEIMKQRIAELAYQKAECRGFEPGHEWEDWLEAEAEVKAVMYSTSS